MTLISISAWSQNGFNYKALISDNGNVLSNQTIDIRFTVLQNGVTNIYQEVQSAQTDANGIVSVNIGEGSVVSGDFSTIEWTLPQSLKVEIDTGSGYQNFGTKELKYVPTAKYAEKAGNVFSGDYNDLSNRPNLATVATSGNYNDLSNRPTLATVATSGDYNDLTNTPTLATVATSGNFSDLNNIPAGLSDGDDDTHLTDAQIAAMGYIKDPNDADHDTTNELQDLSLSGSTLNISNGTGVTFTGWDTDSSDDVQSLGDLSDAVTVNACVGLGTDVLHAAVGMRNVAVGRDAGYSNQGEDNVFIGHSAGHNIQGSNNVIIGQGAGNNATGSGNVFIGRRAGYFELGSNKLYIDNSNTHSPLIYGDFSSDELTVNGSLSIKDGTQGAGKVLISDANGKAQWSNLPPQTYTIDYGVMDIVPAYTPPPYTLSRSYALGSYYNTSTGNNAMHIPLDLPEESIINSITVYYKDHSTQDISIKLYRHELSSQSVSNLITQNTTGDSNTIRSIILGQNFHILSGYSYFIVFKPKSGDHWDGSNTALRGVKITYTK